jgi:hypothetical protein
VSAGGNFGLKAFLVFKVQFYPGFIFGGNAHFNGAIRNPHQVQQTVVFIKQGYA